MMKQQSLVDAKSPNLGAVAWVAVSHMIACFYIYQTQVYLALSSFSQQSISESFLIETPSTNAHRSIIRAFLLLCVEKPSPLA